MMTATVNEVAEVSGQYGLEKKSKVTLADGESRIIYTKPAAKTIYEALRPGVTVEISAKDSGKGYLISRILPEGEAPAPANGYASPIQPKAPATKQDIAAFIESSAGQYAYCVKCLREKFEALGITDITDDLLKAGATSIFIDLKNKFR